MPKERLEYVTTMKSTVHTTNSSVPTLKNRVIYQSINSDTPKKLKKVRSGHRDLLRTCTNGLPVMFSTPSLKHVKGLSTVSLTSSGPRVAEYRE